MKKEKLLGNETDSLSLDNNRLSKDADSFLLAKYERAIYQDHFGIESPLTEDQLDSVISENYLRINDSRVLYAPDSSFKILLFEGEYCGAYCNPFWESYIHFNILRNEVVRKSDFSSIDSIYVLPEGKYLILENSSARPASVLTVSCRHARVISFRNDSIITHPIGSDSVRFGYCQENSVEMEQEPYLKYNPSQLRLAYLYGNNYLYRHGGDIDTIREGYLKYKNGQFVLEKETIKVNDKQEAEDN